jgi:protein phosphatase
MHFIIAKRLLLGRFTVSDATHLSPDERREMINIARRFAFEAIAVVFDTPLDTCLGRNARRNRVVPPEALRRQYGMLERTLKTIGGEDFDSVLVLTERDQENLRVLVDSVVPQSATEGR